LSGALILPQPSMAGFHSLSIIQQERDKNGGFFTQTNPYLFPMVIEIKSQVERID
jgi:hypothetical protein